MTKREILKAHSNETFSQEGHRAPGYMDERIGPFPRTILDTLLDSTLNSLA